MERGQLGTGVSRRFIIVWEGAMAELPTKGTAVVARERILRRFHAWDEAVAMWKIHDLMANQIWDLIRVGYRCDVVVTTREKQFARAVSREIERLNIPVSYVWAQTADSLGRELMYRPDVERVFYGLEYQRYSYGPKGFCVTPGHPFPVLTS